MLIPLFLVYRNIKNLRIYDNSSTMRIKKLLFILCSILLSTNISFAGDWTPNYSVISCPNMSNEEIHTRLHSFLPKDAEVIKEDDNFLLAYTYGKTKNCSAVLYTFKFLIDDGQIRYGIYFGKSKNDIGDFCVNEINRHMQEFEDNLLKNFNTTKNR